MSQDSVNSKLQAAKDIRLMGIYCISGDVDSSKAAKKLLKEIKKGGLFQSPRGMECVSRIGTIAKGGKASGPCIVCRKADSIDEGFFCENCKKTVYNSAIKAKAEEDLKAANAQEKASKNNKSNVKTSTGYKPEAAVGDKNGFKLPFLGRSDDKPSYGAPLEDGTGVNLKFVFPVIAVVAVIAIIVMVASRRGILPAGGAAIKDNNLQNALTLTETATPKAVEQLEKEAVAVELTPDGSIKTVSIDSESKSDYSIVGVKVGDNVYDAATAFGKLGAIEDVATEEQIALQYESEGTPNLYKIIFVNSVVDEAGTEQIYRYEALVDIETVIEVKVERLK